MSTFNIPECCNQPCTCPVCLDNKQLMRLNCNHYVCEEDIKYIISFPRSLQKCPICRVPITDYSCNEKNIKVVNVIPYDEESDADDLYGGKRKTNRTRKNNKKRKLNKIKKTNRRCKSRYKFSKNVC